MPFFHDFAMAEVMPGDGEEGPQSPPSRPPSRSAAAVSPSAVAPTPAAQVPHLAERELQDIAASCLIHDRWQAFRICYLGCCLELPAGVEDCAVHMHAEGSERYWQV